MFGKKLSFLSVHLLHEWQIVKVYEMKTISATKARVKLLDEASELF